MKYPLILKGSKPCSVQSSCSVMSDSLWPHGLQHARPPCPSPTPRACSNSCPSSQWCQSNHLILCHPLLLPPSTFPSIMVFSDESVLHVRWPKYWNFSFSISPSNEYPGLISFRIDLLAVQGTLKSLLQHYSSKISILWYSVFFMVQLSHPCMTTGKTIALTKYKHYFCKWCFTGTYPCPFIYKLSVTAFPLPVFSSVQFSHSALSDSLWPHGLQHSRLPYPSPTPKVCSNSCPSHWWCHATILSSLVPFSSCLQSLPASGSFPMSQFFASGSQSIGASASALVLPMNIQDWFPLGLISLQSKDSQVSSPTPQFAVFSISRVELSNCDQNHMTHEV